ncbi:MAG: hypothetical protein JWL72_4584 [Ilumatobacteraceae bacterium]|nr:hypothetical protein [Ilumatobacteraceae bacterium]
MDRPTCLTSGLLVCTGKKCSRSKGFGALVTLAGATSRAHEVPCQGLCKGPVVGLGIDGDVRWFARVRGKKLRTRIGEMLATGRVPTKLRDRESVKRRGQVRGARRLHPLDVRRAAELDR